MVIAAVPEALSTIVCVPPGLAVYVTVAFGVPVKVIVADPLGHTVALLEMATVGGGITVIVIVPLAAAVQLGVPLEVKLTILKTVVTV